MWKKCLLLFCMSLSAHAASLHSENPVTFVDGRTGNMGEPLIASNSKGDAILFMTTYSPRSEKPSQEETLCLAFKNRDSFWSEPRALHQAEWISQVNAVVDEAGCASFCWIEYRDEKKSIYYGQKSKDDFWVTLFCHDFKGDTIDLLPSGEIICTGDTDDMGTIIQTDKLIKYQFFNMNKDEPGTYYYSWDNCVSFNQQGEAVAIQRGSNWRDNTRWIKASWYQNSQWSPAQFIYQGSSYGYGLQALKGNDLAAVYWKDQDDLNLLTFLNGQTSSNKFSVGYEYDIALGPNDEICVAGQSQKNYLDLFFQDRNREVHTSSLPLPISGEIDNVLVKVDTSGNCLVVWKCRTKVLKNLHLETRSVVYGAVFSGTTQQWSTPVVLSPTHFSCGEVSLTLSDKGRCFVAWEASNGKDQGVQVVEISYDE